ncbi:hypothetical protein HK098_005160 [Nowakowskiella sp. JEL0407]|nr:hypothetical protein HK098_005160 [Nowakowskiella sp. JEL0407]
MAVGLFKRRVTILQLLQSWFLSYIGNFIGSVFTATVLVWLAGINVATKESWQDYLIHTANSKVVDPTWVNLFLRGIGCNWLVCLAVFMSLGAQDSMGKIASIYIPITIFITVSYEHCIANQFTMPLSLMVSGWGQNLTEHVGFDFWMFLWKNLLPVTLGNIVGGGVFVGMVYGYVFLI